MNAHYLKYKDSMKTNLVRWREANPDRVDTYRTRKRLKRQAIKQELINLLGGSCVQCGYNKHPAALQFDHIDPSTKASGIAVLLSMERFDEAREEIKKCQLLCGNCHAEKTWGETI